jgi:hypothetical protein
MYNRLPLYAKLQTQAEDPVTVARMQAGLQSPVYQDLQRQVGDPSFQTRLQAQMYRAAPRYVDMEARVQDPSYGTDLQQRMYRGIFRPGPDSPPQTSAISTAVETMPAPQGKGIGRQPMAPLPSHVP